jgi:hypothetical protein
MGPQPRLRTQNSGHGFENIAECVVELGYVSSVRISAYEGLCWLIVPKLKAVRFEGKVAGFHVCHKSNTS